MSVYCTRLQVHSNLAVSGASGFRVKVLSEAFQLLCQHGKEEVWAHGIESFKRETVPSSQACPGYGREGSPDGAGAAATTSSPLKGFMVFSKPTNQSNQTKPNLILIHFC